MHDKMSSEFLGKINQDSEHPEQRYRELEPCFGIILLRTELAGDAESSYLTYKKRWKIETHYNHVRNGADFNGLHEQNYYTTQGVSFLVLVEGQIYASFMQKLKHSEDSSIKYMSKNECMAKASRMKIIKHRDGRWHTSIVKSKTRDMLTELGIDADSDIESMNKGTYGNKSGSS